ncbi:MAG: divergent polysaccharide deacetylase family protein [Parvularculaceae bacterium]
MASKKHKQNGPVLSRLGWAWLGLGLVLAIGSIAAWKITGQTAQRADAAIQITGAPDKFAMPETEISIPDAPVMVEQAPIVVAAAVEETGITLTDMTSDGGSGLLIPTDPEPEFSSTPPEKRLLERLSEADAVGLVINADALPTPEQAAHQRSVRKLKRPFGTKPGDLRPEMISSLGLPKIASDRRASTHYARAYKDRNKRPMSGVIVGGLGLDPSLARAAIHDLPPEITLAFAPYAKEIAVLTEEARRAGHEVLIELPMDTHGVDQGMLGPAALLTTYTATQNRERLIWVLSRSRGYFGVINYLGQKYSSDDLQFSSTLDIIRGSGLAYIDDTGVGRASLQRNGLPWTSIDMVLAESSLGSQLRALDVAAENQGAALARAYVSPTVISSLQDWTSKRDTDRTALAPASAILAAKR